jgi:hypothetical protein
VLNVPGPGRGDNIDVDSVDLTAFTGALFARSLVLVPDDAGVAAIVALRGPDALARFVFDDATGAFALTHLSESCLEPTNLAFVSRDVGGDTGGGGEGEVDVDVTRLDRVLVTCQSGEVVQALDALTLDVEDSLRFLGRNPYGLAVDPVHAEAFVSFFLDDSVGVVGLVDDDGAPRLTSRGRLGKALPPPEDGRE